MVFCLNQLFYMNSKSSEAATLPNSGSPTSQRVNWDGPGKYYFRRLRERFSPAVGTGKTHKTPKQIRFSKAFHKALAVRSRVLGRRLSRPEWQALKAAVRKQCSARMLPFEVRLQQLSDRIGQVANLVPVSVQSVDDSLSLFRVQLSILRQQAMDLVQEQSDVKETCSHFRNRTLCHLPLWEEPQLFENVPGIEGIISLNGQNRDEQLCCSKCLLARQDTFYTWSGDDLVFEDSSTFGSLSRREQSKFRNISPLSFQSVWSQLISCKYRKTI